MKIANVSLKTENSHGWANVTTWIEHKADLKPGAVIELDRIKSAFGPFTVLDVIETVDVDSCSGWNFAETKSGGEES